MAPSHSPQQSRYYPQYHSEAVSRASSFSGSSLNQLSAFTTADGSESDGRNSSDESSLPTDTILDIGSHTDAASSDAQTDSFFDEQHQGAAAESTARLLHFGGLEDASFVARSRAPSPGPSSAQNSPPTNNAAVHIHHHYHHGSPLNSARRFGVDGSTAALTSRSAPASASTSHDNVPDFFLSENYRTSNLARKLGFSAPNPDALQNKRRNSPAGLTIGPGRAKWWNTRKSRRRDSNIRDPPPSYAMIDSANTLASGSSSPTAFLESNSTSKWQRSEIGAFVTTCCARMLRSPFVPTQPLSILFTLVLLISLLVSTTTLTVHVLNTDKAPLPWRTFCQEQAPFPHDLADSLPPTNLFVGVFSVDASYERRHLIRSTYMRHTKPIDPNTGKPAGNIQVKFILGRPRPTHTRRVALEMETYNDIVVLDLKENMNKGKTHAFFKWAAENATLPFYYSIPSKTSRESIGVAFRKADYVVKADDDAFLILSELERHLRVSPRQHTYWGYLVRNLFMAGEAYAMSSDLVDYIANYAPLEEFVTGSEDKRVARWMRMHPNATSINWVTERCWIYDHPKAGTTYSHGFLFPDQVERIRLEGARGLSEEEKSRRGGNWAQSWSSVSTWKKAYTLPAPAMSMEEQVEALVEGGGHWGPEDDWKQERISKEQYIDYAKMRFDANDPRLVNNTELRVLAGIVTPSPAIGKRASPVSPFRHNRVPSDLIVDLQGPLPQVPDEKENLPPPTNSLPIPKQHHVQIPSDIPDYERLVPPPVLRYDAARMLQRDSRMLGRPHGGTVVVHFLKRNEWFMEAALALLGRHRTWDDGIEAYAFATRPLTAAPSTLPVASSLNKWTGTGQLSPVNNVWGSARMHGSPIVRENGYIDEGREAAFERATKLPVDAQPARGIGKLRGRPRLGYADPEDATEPVTGNSTFSGEFSSSALETSISASTNSLNSALESTLPPLIIQPGAGH